VAHHDVGSMIEPPGVQIFGQRELVDHLAAGGRHYSHCISIGNPGRGFGRPDTTEPPELRRHFRRILRLAFYDVENRSQLGTMRPRRVPRRSDVRRVIRFFRRTREQATGYTLHCWGGVSRSPAMALGVLYLLTGSEDEAGQLLRRLRPDAAPHRMIVEYFDELLGCRLAAVSDAIRAEHIQRMRRQLDLSADALLEELPGAEGENEEGTGAAPAAPSAP
jgi:predicted protein tyrosine phosphatase